MNSERLFSLVAKLHDFADRLDEMGKADDADSVDRIAGQILEAYKMRVRKQRRSRGITRVRRKKYYRQHRQKIKMRQKRYRRKHKVHLKRRKKFRHYKRIGSDDDMQRQAATKAKKGDIVQSFDVTMPIDETRGSVIGKVVDVKVDKKDGIEYVYITAFTELRNGKIVPLRRKKVRAPQNGTPVAGSSKVTDGILVG